MERMNLTEIQSRVALKQADEQRQLLEQFAEGKNRKSASDHSLPIGIDQFLERNDKTYNPPSNFKKIPIYFTFRQYCLHGQNYSGFYESMSIWFQM